MKGGHEQGRYEDITLTESNKSWKVPRLKEINKRSNSGRLGKMAFFHYFERVETMRNFWEEKANEPDGNTEDDEVSFIPESKPQF